MMVTDTGAACCHGGLVPSSPPCRPPKLQDDDLVTRGILAPECQRIVRRDKDEAGFGLHGDRLMCTTNDATLSLCLF